MKTGRTEGSALVPCWVCRGCTFFLTLAIANSPLLSLGPVFILSIEEGTFEYLIQE